MAHRWQRRRRVHVAEQLDWRDNYCHRSVDKPATSQRRWRRREYEALASVLLPDRTWTRTLCIRNLRRGSCQPIANGVTLHWQITANTRRRIRRHCRRRRSSSSWPHRITDYSSRLSLRGGAVCSLSGQPRRMALQSTYTRRAVSYVSASFPLGTTSRVLCCSSPRPVPVTTTTTTNPSEKKKPPSEAPIRCRCFRRRVASYSTIVDATIGGAAPNVGQQCELLASRTGATSADGGPADASCRTITPWRICDTAM